MNGLPESYFSTPYIALLRKKVRRRAFLVRRRAELKVKIQSVLTYEGIKLQRAMDCSPRKGAEWFWDLGLETVDCYLKQIPPQKEEIGRFSRELQLMAKGDEDVRLLMSIPGVDYDTVFLLKAEVGDIGNFPFKECLCSYSGLVPSTKRSGGIARHSRITREGFRWLRLTLVKAILVYLRYDTPITRAYHRIAERRSQRAPACRRPGCS